MTEPAAQQVRVHATCTHCRQQAAVNEYDRDRAMDLLDALGWWDLETFPLCPQCASYPNAERGVA